LLHPKPGWQESVYRSDIRRNRRPATIRYGGGRPANRYLEKYTTAGGVLQYISSTAGLRCRLHRAGDGRLAFGIFSGREDICLTGINEIAICLATICTGMVF